MGWKSNIMTLALVITLGWSVAAMGEPTAAIKAEKVIRLINLYFRGLGIPKKRYSVIIRVPHGIAAKKNTFVKQRLNIIVQLDGIHRLWIENKRVKEEYTPLAKTEITRHALALKHLFGADHSLLVEGVAFDYAKERDILTAEIRAKQKLMTTFYIIIVPVIILILGVVAVIFIILAIIKFLLPKPKR